MYVKKIILTVSVVNRLLVLASSMLALTFSAQALSVDGDLDASFSVEQFFEDRVSTSEIAIAADGRVLLGGQFAVIDGHRTLSVARINTDGTVDTTFSAAVEPEVNSGGPVAIVPLADGKLLIGGSFRIIDGQNQPFLARLNSDGSLDTAFTPTLTFRASDIALDADGKILIAANVTMFNDDGEDDIRQRIARLNADGTLDTTFDAGAINNVVQSISVQSNGNIIIGGNFTTIQGMPRNRVARLLPTGELDDGFDPNVEGFVSKVLVQSDQKVLIGGSITSVAETARSRLARVNADGSLDAGFDPAPDSSVLDMAQFSSGDNAGDIVVVGQFRNIAGERRASFAVIDNDGALNGAFIPLVSGILSAVAIQNNNQVVMNVSNSFGNGATRRNLLLRLLADGSIDDTLLLNGLRRGLSALSLTDDRSRNVYLGGLFSQVGDQARDNLVRFDRNGVVDTSYSPNPNARVDALIAQRSGKLIVGGSFSELAGEEQRGIARLNSDGSFDASFNANASLVLALDEIANGDILVAGNSVEIFNGALSSVGRFDSEGNPIESFNPVLFGNTGSAFFIKSVADDKILIAGNFDQVNGRPQQSIARLNADGSLDTTFADPMLSGTIAGIEVLNNGQILVVGNFFTIDFTQVGSILLFNDDGTRDVSYTGSLNSNITASQMQPDGKIILAGRFTSFGLPGVEQPVTQLIRLDENALLDPSFVSTPNPNPQSLALQNDGKLLVAGGFTEFNGQALQGVVRVETGLVIELDIDPEACFVVPIANKGVVNFCL